MSDEQIEQELREAAQFLDPVPPHLVDAAVAAFTWRTIDADLAELVYDTLTEPAATVRDAGVPEAEHPRLLTFQTPSLTIELEVLGDRNDRRLVGRISPAAAVDLEIRHRGGGSVAVSADPLGRFAATGLASGPTLLRVQPAGNQPAVVTDWFSL